MLFIPRVTLPVKIAIIVLVVLGLIFAGAGVILRAVDYGPAQPVPFSHRIHAGTKDISCFFCHQYATVSANAGIPSVEKCLLCHNVIVPRWRPVEKIHEYAQRNEPIPWVRVNRMPEFTHFSHQAHLARGFDCSRCHGNVKEMDRIRPVYKFDMKFCVNCHWENNFSTNCYICHW
ncbi:MAG: cytochrome c3 family protein [Armatimonadetes bacterium]|nr:cytochrome c3 family protein [Armatimonadota bacterium]